MKASNKWKLRTITCTKLLGYNTNCMWWQGVDFILMTDDVYIILVTKPYLWELVLPTRGESDPANLQE